MTLQAQVSNIVPGQVLHSRFEVSGVAVVDGFGTVLSALDRRTNKPVSLRMLRTPNVVAAVKQQLRQLGSTSHANVIPTYGVVSAEGADAVLVQGPISGKHLAAFVTARTAGEKPISLRGAYNVVAHVCNALSAVHGTGPHGAVRPSSVWMGDDGRVQLADLVLSRALLATGGTAGLPDADVAYLAPEIKGGGRPTPASDIFGLGALLYVLLTGRSPTDEFVVPSEAHPEVTPAVDAELFKALAPDPSQRHASPDAFRTALLPLMGDAAQESSADFGRDIEIEVNLSSVVPSRAPGPRAGTPELRVPKAPHVPTIDPHDAPQIGMRVSMGEGFRVSIVEDEGEADAARKRKSLGEVDLKDVLAKITEDDAPRWMLVKNGMDHGPFSGRQVVNMVVQGEAQRDHELLNTDTGRRGKVKEFPEFQEFLAQYELRRSEVERAQALASAETAEKRSAVYKIGVALAVLSVIGAGAGIYALSRSGAGNGRADAELDDLYKRGEVDFSGSAGILPAPKRSGGRRSGAGGSGGGASYEEAMMQAIDIGSAASGGEQQLTPQTVAGVMNKNLNSIANACVRGSVGTVKIDMAIAGSGQVMGVSVTGGDAGMQRCVADQVRRVRFPAFSAPRMGARFTFGT